MNEYMKECLSKWREISLKISIIHPSLIILSFFLKVLVWLLPYSSLHRWLQRRNSWMSQLQQNYRHETKDLTDQWYWKLKITSEPFNEQKWFNKQSRSSIYKILSIYCANEKAFGSYLFALPCHFSNHSTKNQSIRLHGESMT